MYDRMSPWVFLVLFCLLFKKKTTSDGGSSPGNSMIVFIAFARIPSIRVKTSGNDISCFIWLFCFYNQIYKSSLSPAAAPDTL